MNRTALVGMSVAILLSCVPHANALVSDGQADRRQFPSPGFGNCHNLLRNSSFLQRTNVTVPDYWDLYRVAAINLRSLHEHFGVDDKLPSPLPHTNVLKVINSRKDFPYLHVIPVRIQETVPAGEYSLSVYAKSEKESSTIRIFSSWSDQSPSSQKLGKKWKRISLTFRYSGKKDGFLQPILNFPDNDTYYVAAPQLESGSLPSSYQPACADYSMNDDSLTSKTETHRILARLTQRASNHPDGGDIDFKRYVVMGGKPFFIIGIAVGNWGLPPDWYFSDLRSHGINTVFYLGATEKYDIHIVESFITAAARYDLKVIVGLPLAGYKPPDWRLRLWRFTTLIEALKGNPAIIGWYPVDEPEASTWNNDEVKEIFETIKQIDPHRVIFVNWAYNGVPSKVGEEPRGTLQATDIYSIDDYPFAVYRKGLPGFTDTTLRALETSRLKNKISHSWLQIYGDNDAWREPTSGELNYMAYLNLLYGGMYSYWNTKSNSAATWNTVAKINSEASFLSQTLFTDPNAVEIKPPTFEDGFLHSIWQKGEDTYLIVVNSRDEVNNFNFQLSTYSAGRLKAKSIFENRLINLTGKAMISDVFRAFESKVYSLVR